ncbi:hypothetical protein [Aliarcobacter vitoriensis]|uniref:Uncharacterized protein n=1 Tax=Aliarcobacter vitoriensis TaxID=2011099 RepID=A0A366MQP6_9BACT|nr:hypothetical protein [Aliarcobacter vitoriensis]RBQ28153.1 hypothetical protein CRU91_10745 [Aliarcobacter vitoriensis]RBQ30480.1 hypothetical protein CRU92_11990 [Arcobacter sp. FW59]
MNKENKSTLTTIILPLVAIFTIVIGYFFIDFNLVYQSFKGDVNYVVQDKGCDLHKSSCEIVIQDGTKFVLSIEPKNIPLMEPLTFSIKSNKDNLENLTLNIYATNMFMGEFNLPIKNLGNGNYEAIGTLPTCPVGKMQWNADIKVVQTTQDIGARFQFETDM